MKKDLPLILALDTDSIDEAYDILDEIGDSLHFVKVGHRLFAQGGRTFVTSLISRGFNVFLDLKLHDIPNTVKIALEEYLDLGIWAITLHTAGGSKMLEYAAEAKRRQGSDTYLLGVTVLTSHNADSWEEINPGCLIENAIVSRAKICLNSGLDGLVCSPMDLPLVGKTEAGSLIKVVPGIRLSKNFDDQKRVTSPLDAIKGGADYIVVGRPILSSTDKIGTVKLISTQISEGLKWKGIHY